MFYLNIYNLPKYQRIAEHRLARHSVEFAGSQRSQRSDGSPTQLQLLTLPHGGEHFDQFPWRPDLNWLHLCRGLGQDPVVGQHALQPGGLGDQDHLDHQVGGCFSAWRERELVIREIEIGGMIT